MFTNYHDFWVEVPIEKVFETISTSYELNNWWTLRCTGKCELGAVYNLYFSDEYNWFAEITKLEHNKSIEFKMTKAMEEWIPTSFGFNLVQEKPNVTYIQFYHKNWTEESKEYKISNFCWANLLRQMKQYLEKGTITPFEERN